MAEGSIQIQNLKKSFGKTDVLKGINLNIDDGEFVILVGPSGCGKSTLLNCIAGLDMPSDGRVMFDGIDVTKKSPKNRDIAMVFQSYALYPSMTVRQNLGFGLRVRKWKKHAIAKKVDEVAGILQIKALLDRKPSELSGGQRQRVAMGRAMVRDPKLYLFDEPLSNLDAKLRVDMRKEVKELHARVGKTIVYVTHDQIEAMTLGDKIAIMHRGEIVQFGSPHEIYNTPKNVYVAQFIGSPSMNVFRTHVVEKDGKKGVQFKPGEQELFLPLSDKLEMPDREEVLIGIRPEAVISWRRAQSQPENFFRFDIPIGFIEPTGPDTLVFLQVNGSAFIARSRPHHVPPRGEMMGLALDRRAVAFFDVDTHQRIPAARLDSISLPLAPDAVSL